MRRPAGRRSFSPPMQEVRGSPKILGTALSGKRAGDQDRGEAEVNARGRVPHGDGRCRD
jgi:hypothetical protein